MKFPGSGFQFGKMQLTHPLRSFSLHTLFFTRVKYVLSLVGKVHRQSGLVSFSPGPHPVDLSLSVSLSSGPGVLPFSPPFLLSEVHPLPKLTNGSLALLLAPPFCHQRVHTARVRVCPKDLSLFFKKI